MPAILPSDALTEVRRILATAPWVDGRTTAGWQAGEVKHNEQVAENSPQALAAGRIVLEALSRSALFFSAALPRRIFPPLFNRYAGAANVFGDHVDTAVRTIADTGERVRTDLSATLFLADPEDYDGGELIIDEPCGNKTVKLPAGDLILYPATSVHRVEPVTRGARIASFFWIESMVRGDDQRRLLFDADMAILALRQSHGDSAPLVRLTGTYHNLLRMWAHA